MYSMVLLFLHWSQRHGVSFVFRGPFLRFLALSCAAGALSVNSRPSPAHLGVVVVAREMQRREAVLALRIRVRFFGEEQASNGHAAVLGRDVQRREAFLNEGRRERGQITRRRKVRREERKLGFYTEEGGKEAVSGGGCRQFCTCRFPFNCCFKSKALIFLLLHYH